MSAKETATDFKIVEDVFKSLDSETQAMIGVGGLFVGAGVVCLGVGTMAVSALVTVFARTAMKNRSK